MRSCYHGTIRLQQRRPLAVEVVIGDHVERLADGQGHLDQMGVGGKMPEARATIVEIRDVAGTHRQQRPTQARIADAAAVRMRVVGRGAILDLLLGVPGIGTPRGLPRAECVVDIAALMIPVDLVGEGGREKDDRRGRGASRRQSRTAFACQSVLVSL